MKILLFAYTGLGNFILKTPLVSALHREYPGAEVHLLCGNEWGADKVLEHGDWIKSVHWLPEESSWLKRHKVFSFLRSQCFDLIFMPFDSSSLYLRLLSRFYFRKAEIVAHLGLKRTSLSTLLLDAFNLVFLRQLTWVPIIRYRHEIDLNLDLLRAVLDRPFTANRETFLTWVEEDLSELSVPDSYIVFQPFARNGQSTPKTWNPRNFLELAGRWRKRYPGDTVVLVGDMGDAKAAKNYGFREEDGLLNLMGRTTFSQLCNVISRARVIVANDSGTMHVADALSRPLVALYGPTDFSRTAPLRSTSRILYSRNECFAKMYGWQFTESELAMEFPNYYCMSGITVDQVEDALEDLIGEK